MGTESVSNALLDAMQIVVQSAIRNLQYDTTIECKIVDHSKRAQHIYTVRSQEATFDVRNNNQDITYYKGDIVYVTIPRGDMDSSEKFILGKKETSNSGGSFLFKSPFDNFVEFEQIGLETSDAQYSFVANYPQHQLVNFTTFEFEEPHPNPSSQMGIQMDVQTALSRAISGKYGLKIEVIGEVRDEDNKLQPHRMSFFFTTDDMYGNVYAFNSPFTQQRVFDISEFESIDKILLSGYQDLQFKDIQGNMIPYKNNQGDIFPSNIFFKNIKLFLGEHVSILELHPAYIHTSESLRYGEDVTSSESQRENNKRSMALTWMQSGGDSENTSDDIVVKNFDNFKKLWQNKYQENQYSVYWYRYRAGYTHDAIVDNKQTELKNDGQEYNKDEKPILDAWKYAGPSWQYLDPASVDNPQFYAYQAFEFNNEDYFHITVYPDIDQVKERYKAVVKYDIYHDVSNIIEFVNESKIIDPSTVDGTNEQVIIQLLRAVTDADSLEDINEYKPIGESTTKKIPYLIVDNTLQYRYVYDERNSILHDNTGTKYSSIPYYAIVCKKNEDGEYVPFLPDDVNNMDVSWKLPDTHTMLNFKEDISDEDDDDNKYYEIRALISYLHPDKDLTFGSDKESIETIKDYVSKYRQIIKRYYINATFHETKRDNTIAAVVKYNDKVYNPKKQIDFGQMGNNGSEYSLAISCRPIFKDNVSLAGLPEGNYTCTKWREHDSIGVEYTVYALDKLGARVSLENKTVSWRSLSIKDDNAYANPESPTINQSGGVVARFMYIWSEEEQRYSTAHIPTAVEVTVRGLESYPIVARKSFPLYREAEIITTHKFLYPERIEFKSNGDAPLYYNGDLLAEKNDEGTIDFKWNFYSSQGLTPREELTIYDNNRIRFNLPQKQGYPQWTDEFVSKKNNKAAVIYLQGTYSTNTWTNWTVRHAIVFDQNVYASSLLNKWNGSDLVLDEEHGAILANAVAAGVKNSLDNTFSGVIMGSWREFGDASIEYTGLYGFQNGAQTFALKTDGTGFIGPSGAGRIYFDGRNAHLSNADKTSYISLNRSNTFDHFLYSQKDEENFTAIGHDGTFEFQKHASSEEEWNTIFSVTDSQGFYLYSASAPNNSYIEISEGNVSMSGKIIAGSGEIGGWKINKRTLESSEGSIILDPDTPHIKVGNTYLQSDGRIVTGSNNGLKIEPGESPYLIVGPKDDDGEYIMSQSIKISSGKNSSIEIGDAISLHTNYVYGNEATGQPTVVIGMKKSDGSYTGRLILGGLVMIGTTTKQYSYTEVKNFSLGEKTKEGTVEDDTNFTIKDGVVYVLDKDGKPISKKDENGNTVYETVDTISSDATVNFNPIEYSAVFNKASTTAVQTATISAGTGYLSLGGSLILPKDAVVGCEDNGYLIGNWQIAAKNASISDTLYANKGYIENLYVGNLSFGAGGMATEQWVANWIQKEWGLSQKGVNSQINDVIGDIASLSSQINKTARIANNAASDAQTAVANAVTGGAITVQGSELGTLSITLKRENGTLGPMPLTNSSAEFATQNHHHNPRLEVGQFGSITLKYNKGYSDGTPASAKAITGFAYNLRVDGDTLKWYDGLGTEKSFKKADAPTAASASATYTYLVDRSGSNLGFDIRVGDTNDNELFIKQAGVLRVRTNGDTTLRINVYDNTIQDDVAYVDAVVSVVLSQQVTTTSLGKKNVTATAKATITANGVTRTISKSVTESGL